MNDPINWIFGVLTGVAILWIIVASLASLGKGDHIDADIKNEIIGYDRRTGAYLVRAKTIWNIEGGSKHIDGNLDANIYYGGKGLYVVDFQKRLGSNHDSMDWQELNFETFPAGYEILPRGATETDGTLADQVLGYKWHTYIHEIGTPYPDNRHEGLRKS